MRKKRVHVNEVLPLLILLSALAMFNIVMVGLTIAQFGEQSGAGVGIRIGAAVISILLIYGMLKLKPWALYIGIIYMSFGIINSIWSILVSVRLELPVIFGAVMLTLFGATLYYLIRKRNIFIKNV